MNRKLDIAKKAAQLFKTAEYEKIDIRLICEHCHIPRSTFYYYFHSKEELLLYLLNKDIILSDSRLNEIEDIHDPLSKLLNTHGAFAEYCMILGTQILKEKYTIQMEKGNLFRSAYDYHAMTQKIIPLIKEAQNQNQIRNFSKAEELAEAVTQMMMGTTFIWVSNSGSYDLKKAMLHNLKILYHVNEDEGRNLHNRLFEHYNHGDK